MATEVGNEVAESLICLCFLCTPPCARLPITDMLRINGLACHSGNWLLPTSLNTHFLQALSLDYPVCYSCSHYVFRYKHSHTVACQVRRLCRTVSVGSVIMGISLLEFVKSLDLTEITLNLFYLSCLKFGFYPPVHSLNQTCVLSCLTFSRLLKL